MHGQRPTLPSRQQTLTRHVINLNTNAIGILEQHRVIPRRPRPSLRRMHNLRADRLQEAVYLVNVAAFPRAQANVMQPDSPLLKTLPPIRVLASRDTHRSPSADAVEHVLAPNHRRHPDITNPLSE